MAYSFWGASAGVAGWSFDSRSWWGSLLLLIVSFGGPGGIGRGFYRGGRGGTIARRTAAGGRGSVRAVDPGGIATRPTALEYERGRGVAMLFAARHGHATTVSGVRE